MTRSKVDAAYLLHFEKGDEVRLPDGRKVAIDRTGGYYMSMSLVPATDVMPEWYHDTIRHDWLWQAELRWAK